MSNISYQRTGTFLRTLFQILLKESEPLKARDALDKLAAQVEMSEYEKGSYGSGVQRFDQIVRFATVDCAKAGWLVKNKGYWSVTDLGKEALSKYQDGETFYREAVKLYYQWKNQQPTVEPSEVPEPESGETEAKTVAITYELADEQAWKEISEHLAKMPPYQFQDLVAALIRALGYHVAWTAPPGKDGGIDIIAWPDALGTKPPRIKVQVKRQQQTIAVDGLRSFMAMLRDDDVGLFVSLGGFTKDAKDEARMQENRKIRLLDEDQLVELWIEHYDKIADQDRRHLPLKPIYFLSPEG